MKIEIEFEEVENLKKQLERSEKRINELEILIKGLSPEELKKASSDLALKMFYQFTKKIFTEIGISCSFDSLHFENLPHYLGQKWYESDKIEITFGAVITNKYKSAILRLGIKPE
jgi:hypothetical protein